MLVDVVTEFAAEVVRPAAAEADEACAAPDALLKASLEIGLPILGVPGALGGISEERSAMAGTLVAEALAKGDMGLAVAALAPGAVATALVAVGHRRAAADLPAGVHRRRRAGRRARAHRADACCSTCSRRRPPPPRTGDGYVLERREVSWSPRGADAELFVVGAPARRRARRCSSSSPAPTASTIEADPAMGVRAAAPDPARPRRRHGRPPTRCSARPTARRTPSACGCRASPGAPSRSAPARPCSTTSRRTSTSARRSASRSATASRSRSWSPTSPSSCRRCGWSPTRPPPAPPRARTSPARSRWPASCAPTRACRSASTASSCSAATASSRSTRSSGGTATCGPSASWKEAVLV